MSHDTPLIAMIAGGLALAFVFGAAAHRLRVSPLVGYLLAGVAIGPYTPGFVGNQDIANELAEIGVILLMFGVGLHFSLKDLMSVRAIAIPGAFLQIAVATVLGIGLAEWLGWTLGAGLVFGLALSVASTVVLLRAIQERRLVNTERGRIAIGWLIVEDVVMVLTLVLLPAIAPLLGGKPGPEAAAAASSVDSAVILQTLAITIAKVAAFFTVMMVAGRRIIPWVLHYTAHTGSRELFRLAVLAIALGVAYGAAMLFGVSFALGAFFAGMILSESELSQRAANETLPLRDAFAVLFFVSVGMLFDPRILVDDAPAVLAVLFIVVIGKSLAALAIVLLFRHPLVTAVTIAVSLAQIGEFSFILATLGFNLDLLPDRGRDLILAGALLSIVINPLFFVLLDRLNPWLEKRDAASGTQSPLEPAETTPAPTALKGHTVVVGAGRVGRRITEALQGNAASLYVIDETQEQTDRMHDKGIEAVTGNAVSILYAANLPEAAALVVSIPNSFEAGQVIAKARAANATMPIVARAHSEAEADHLRKFGATDVVIGEEKIADAMVASYLATIKT